MSNLDEKKRKDFGDFLLGRRKKLGYSVREVANIVGTPFGVLASIERGEKAKIRVDMVEHLAALYDVNSDMLHIMCERIPQKVFYKIIRNPELLDIVRAWKE